MDLKERAILIRAAIRETAEDMDRDTPHLFLRRFDEHLKRLQDLEIAILGWMRREESE